MRYAVLPWTLPYWVSWISILSSLVYIHVLFSLCSFPLNIGFLLPWHSFRFSCFSESFFSLSLYTSLPSSRFLIMWWCSSPYYHCALFNSDCSVVSLSLQLCDLSSLFPPFLFLLSSYSSHDLLDLFFSLHTSWYSMSQFWQGPSRASSLMNVSATWIFHAPCSCLLNDSANSKAHWLKFHFILLDVFLFFLFAQDGVCLSA